jgi:hypothetical protein
METTIDAREIKVNLSDGYPCAFGICLLSAPTTMIQIPQPIFIQSAPVSYHQQAANSPSSWMVDNHPMLPQPSAPPQPMDSSYGMDRPPPYEKVCMTNRS